MELPSVRVERQPILHILLASVEVYNRECLGYLYGSQPTPKRNQYIVRAAVPLQAIHRRTSTKAYQSKRSYARLDAFLRDAKPLYQRLIGDFHSHTYLRKKSQPIGLSGEDIEGMKADLAAQVKVFQQKGRALEERDWDIGMVVNIAPRGKNILPWRILSQGTRLRGTLGLYRFHLSVFRLVQTDEGFSAQALSLVVPTAVLRSLNRRIGKS